MEKLFVLHGNLSCISRLTWFSLKIHRHCKLMKIQDSIKTWQCCRLSIIDWLTASKLALFFLRVNLVCARKRNHSPGSSCIKTVEINYISADRWWPNANSYTVNSDIQPLNKRGPMNWNYCLISQLLTFKLKGFYGSCLLKQFSL